MCVLFKSKVWNKSHNLIYCFWLQPVVGNHFSEIKGTFPVPFPDYVTGSWLLCSMVSACFMLLVLVALWHGFCLLNDKSIFPLTGTSQNHVKQIYRLCSSCENSWSCWVIPVYSQLKFIKEKIALNFALLRTQKGSSAEW